MIVQNGVRHIWRRRLLKLTASSPFIFSFMWFTYARIGNDKFFQQHWRYAEPMMAVRTHSFALWQKSLSFNERECMQAWLNAMSLSTPSHNMFSPLFVLQDTMLFICSYSEWCNAIDFLLKFKIIQTAPYCTEIRREKQGDVIFIHGKLETELTLRIPFTHKTFQFIMPSIVSLQLEENKKKNLGNHYHNYNFPIIITGAEHRWFGGPLASQQSSSLRSPWGDIGDLSRRFNAFLLSSVMMVGEKLSVLN